ncbi:MAG: AAA family ATPase [Gammaproteobacteria bacterium]|nr:AAA family ATPase [Gammaproteobacteria bacterium]MBT8150537.1 AAA family ATPase [Gammaproteobacteria bacterium]NND39279.1 AAA family ATPase [Pseudomonadales bacterium]NNM10620.1 AAA family ATPase [Pseudomonadales bacterium]RZV60026.1 MAG: AAA family ATPase [Pseudomonadales bacterium]
MNSDTHALQQLRDYLASKIIGQSHLVERLLLALLADGHLLVEGAPGLAKTRAIRALADGLEADFQRIQFTPDLLPGDVTGTDVFRPQTGDFEFQPGPIFHNLVLADEINRAPAKVQAALLEAMAERQVSVGKQTYTLPALFLVMATQNPIEQEGTYPLPEAQLDRFLMHVKVDYPNANAERAILRLVRDELQAGLDDASGHEQVARDTGFSAISPAAIFSARSEVLALHMADAVEEYIVQLVMATRHAASYDAELAAWIDFGASPRATLALDRCARGYAWLRGSEFVTPDDVRAVAHDALRHRIIVSYAAEAAGVDADQIIARLLQQVPAA